MPISVVFDPPLPSDSPSTFNTKAFTLLGDLNDWSTQANALPGEVATNLSALLASPPVIGGTTPAAGGFTTLSASGGVTNTAGRSNFSSNDAYAIGAKNTGGGPVYFGATDSTASPGGHITNSGGADIISWTNAGAVTIPGNLSLIGGTLGYGAGAGGTVTQATSKGTTVTINKPSGQITMNNAALAGNGGSVTFLINNTHISTGDTLLCAASSGYSGTVNDYSITTATGSGIAVIGLRNNTAGSLGEALVLTFSVLKGATS